MYMIGFDHSWDSGEATGLPLPRIWVMRGCCSCSLQENNNPLLVTGELANGNSDWNKYSYVCIYLWGDALSRPVVHNYTCIWARLRSEPRWVGGPWHLHKAVSAATGRPD